MSGRHQIEHTDYHGRIGLGVAFLESSYIFLYIPLTEWFNFRHCKLITVLVDACKRHMAVRFPERLEVLHSSIHGLFLPSEPYSSRGE